MYIKKISRLVGLSAGILLFGGVNAKAESPYESLKGQFEKNKSHVSVEKLNSFKNSSLDLLLESQQSRTLLNSQRSNTLLKSQKSKSLLASQKSKTGYTTQALTGNYWYENEPNDYVDEADYLPQGDVVIGTFSEYDIDTYAIVLEQPNFIAVAGLMDPSSFSDIGFVLTDELDNVIDFEAVQYDDHQMTAGYNLERGVYYIRALNISDYVTEDEYALAWDILDQQDIIPPSIPEVNHLDDNDTLITGQAEPSSIIEVSLNGTVVASDLTMATGRFSVSLPKSYPAGTVLKVTATDQAGNRSEERNVNVVSSTLTGWVYENQKYYHYTNGVMDKGWLADSGKWFFLDKQTGVKKTGWVLDGGKWYYLDSYGVMKTGWIKDGYSWYFLNSNGSMRTGWLLYNKQWYYLAGSGAMKTGWVKVGTKWYYFYNSGMMAHNTKIGSYRLGHDGAWIK